MGNDYSHQSHFHKWNEYDQLRMLQRSYSLTGKARRKEILVAQLPMHLISNVESLFHVKMDTPLSFDLTGNSFFYFDRRIRSIPS